MQIYDFVLQRYLEHEHPEIGEMKANIEDRLLNVEEQIESIREQLEVISKVLLDVAERFGKISVSQSGTLREIDKIVTETEDEANAMKKVALIFANKNADAQDTNISLDLNKDTDIDIKIETND